MRRIRYNTVMAKKQTRTIRPNFIRFCISILILVVAVVVLLVTLTLDCTSSVAPKSCGANDYVSIQTDPVVDVSATNDASGMTTMQNGAATLITGAIPLPDGVSYTVTAAESAKPALLGFTYEIRRNNMVETYTSNPDANTFTFGSDASYSTVAGVTTFAGNHYRNGFAYGTSTVTLERLSTQWSSSISARNGFAGVCWTGQPLVVTWTGDTLKTLGVRDEFKLKDSLNEVIQCAADGNIYFYELETGSMTRAKISVNVNMFGTPTLDPRGYPMLYVGQGLNEPGTDANRSAIYPVNLITNQVLSPIVSGKDYTGNRSDWSAFDSSPLIIEDTLIWPSENGVLYLTPLNTAYDAAAGTITIAPKDRLKYRYTGTGYVSTSTAGKRWYGYESSVAAFRHYLYLTDNGGRLQCVDLNTLKLLFVTDVGYDTDATPVIEENGNDGTIYVYTVSQVDPTAANAVSVVTKVNGLTGAIVWSKEILGKTGEKGGGKATPHIGKSGTTIGNLLICAFYNVAIDATDADGNVTTAYGGKVVAYDRTSGAEQWTITLPSGAGFTSSPLVTYDSRGNAYLVLCTSTGDVLLYNAASPGNNALSTLHLGERIDATPVSFGNYIVVATTGTAEQPKVHCLLLQ